MMHITKTDSYYASYTVVDSYKNPTCTSSSKKLSLFNAVNKHKPFTSAYNVIPASEAHLWKTQLTETVKMNQLNSFQCTTSLYTLTTGLYSD